MILTTHDAVPICLCRVTTLAHEGNRTYASRQDCTNRCQIDQQWHIECNGPVLALCLRQLTVSIQIAAGLRHPAGLWPYVAAMRSAIDFWLPALPAATRKPFIMTAGFAPDSQGKVSWRWCPMVCQMLAMSDVLLSIPSGFSSAIYHVFLRALQSGTAQASNAQAAY